MPADLTRRRARSGSRRDRRGHEWVGGRLLPPFFITDREEPYRPDLVVWMDLPDGLIVGQNVVAPEETDGAVARVLLAAMEQPLVGPPRRPERIRVAEASLVDELRAVVGEAIEIDVAPTPELDELLEAMLESMPAGDEDESYFEEGRVSRATLGEFFASAECLYRIAPWRVASDDQVLRMDIPALGVEGACVSIIGSLGESLGLLIFPSLAGYEAFAQGTEEPLGRIGRIDLGTDWLALSFERGADLPAAMRREVEAHHWPVADANGYPRVQRYERDGACRPLVERDLRIASACASALSAFFVKHRGLFETERFLPRCESYSDENDLTVRFTIPYEALALFDLDDDAPPRRDVAGAGPSERQKVGRNDPCPCGSGRKYKKCHLPLDEAERVSGGGAAAVHELDARLVSELLEFASVCFGSEWERFSRDFVDVSEALQLALPWSVYHFEIEGETVLDWYIEESGQRITRAERAWFAAQKAAWLSVWEVTAIEPGATVTLRDLLSHESRCVIESGASQELVVRDVLLGRVVDHEGVSLLCGVHPRPLPPLDAAEVVRRARGRLRRKRAVPVERLREERFGRYLIKRWEEAVGALDRRSADPPDLRNTDGEPVLLTTDHFRIEPGARAEVEARLAALEGVERPESDEDPAVYSFLKPGNRVHPTWENTVVGLARLSDDGLRLETNSTARADALRGRVDDACGGLIHHRVREHVDPRSPAVQRDVRGRLSAPPTPEAERLVVDFKTRHYAAWLDQPLPALDGASPREAAGTAQGRTALDLLLKDMENREQRSSGPAAFDFAALRKELQIES
ncbi:MAG: YecA family protein [Candidatus Binatia bacterium]